jgi:hypothetical protein
MTLSDLLIEEIEQLKFYRQNLFILNDEKDKKKNQIEKTKKQKINVEVSSIWIYIYMFCMFFIN